MQHSVISFISLFFVLGCVFASFKFGVSTTESPQIATEIVKEAKVTSNSFDVLFFGDLIYDRNVYKALPDVSSLNKHFQFWYEANIEYKGIQTSFKELSEKSDFVWLNLESSIGKFWSWDQEIDICMHTNKSIAFCSHEDILPVLKDLWFNIVNLANNHSMDAWAIAHLKTIALLEKYGIKYFGYIKYGKKFEENYVYTGSKNWQKFAWHGYDYSIYSSLHKKYCDDLKAYKNDWYVNFVVVHRWPEYTDNHTIYQENIAKQLLKCGGDVIFWWHPHVTQETEIYSGKAVFYSLWNFLFDQYFDERTKVWWYAIFNYNFDNFTFDIQTGAIKASAEE